MVGARNTPWFFRHSRPSWIRLPWWMVGARNPPLILSALQAILDKVTKSLITNQNLECLSAMVNGGGEKSTPWFFRHSRPSWTRSPKAWSRKPTNLNLEFLSAMVNGGGREIHPLILSALQAILDKVTKSLIKEAHKSKLGIPLCHGEWGQEVHPHPG